MNIMTDEEVQKIKEAKDKSTLVVSWYAHSQFDGYHPGQATVRGPFGRWFRVSGGDNGIGDPVNCPTPVADMFDDAKYAALALNSVPRFIQEREELKRRLKIAEDALVYYGQGNGSHNLYGRSHEDVSKVGTADYNCYLSGYRAREALDELRKK